MLADRLGEEWRQRRASGSIDPHMRFSDEGLVVGAGTVLVAAGGSSRDIAIDIDEPRLLALLSAAHRRMPPALGMRHLRKAAIRWGAGEDAMAALHLALSGLERLERPQADAQRLFLAEALLGAGLRPDALLKALDLAEPGIVAKYNPDQPRVPAGNGRTSGQWTAADAGAASAPATPSVKPQTADSSRATAPPGASAATDSGVDAASTNGLTMSSASGPTDTIEFALPGGGKFSLNVPSNWSRMLPGALPGSPSVGISATTGGSDSLSDTNDHVALIASSGDGAGYYNVPSWLDLGQLVALGREMSSLSLASRISAMTQVAGRGGPLDYKWMTAEKEPVYDYRDGTYGGHESVWVPIGNWAFGFVSELGGIAKAGGLYSFEHVFTSGRFDTDNHQADIAEGAKAAREYLRTGALPKIVNSTMNPMAASGSW